MKILYYDCFSGISGDMNLGALVDVGVDKNYLMQELKKLNLEEEYEIIINKDSRKGIEGTKVQVNLKHHHDHCHEHHHDHCHEHHHEHHRNLEDIRKVINTSYLSDNVKILSLNIFEEVAVAEGKIHGKSKEEVHFHEVGAIDSIVDIVGAAICFDYLKVDKVISSSIEVGSGFVNCAHGKLPVPAPATSEILKNIPIKAEGVPFEATTPTGAAILKALVQSFTDKKSFEILKVGYGIGHKDIGEIPNVLRVFLGQEQKSVDSKEIGLIVSSKEEAFILECNIDDMNPELYGYVIERLLEAGAMDVYITPIIMKKNRPSNKLTVLCRDEKENIMKEIIFKETTTIGIRKFKVEKEMLHRQCDEIETPLGLVRIKSCFFNNKKLKSKLEYEDCKKIAKEKGISLLDVYKIIESSEKI